MYKLIDLMKSAVDGNFYREQLTKSPTPKSTDYFYVEKVLAKKKIKGVEHYFVKYLYYPDKFNQYIPIGNFTKKSREILEKK